MEKQESGDWALKEFDGLNPNRVSHVDLRQSCNNLVVLQDHLGIWEQNASDRSLEAGTSRNLTLKLHGLGSAKALNPKQLGHKQSLNNTSLEENKKCLHQIKTETEAPMRKFRLVEGT